MTPKLKVLWLTNNGCSAMELLDQGNQRGGWLSSLEKELWAIEELDLHIGFYHGRNINSFQHGNTTYHPLIRGNKKNKITRYLGRVFGNKNGDAEELKKVLSLVNSVKPDLIHVHGTEDNFGLIQLLTKIPVVVSIQGILNPIKEKFYSGIPANVAAMNESILDRISLKSAKYSFNAFKKGAIREKAILRNSKYIIGRTDWDRTVTRVLAPNSKYFVGQEMLRPHFSTINWKKARFDGKIKIVTIISDGHFKGFETIIKTAQLLSEYGKLDFEWLVIGLSENSSIVRITNKWLNIDHRVYGVKLLGIRNEVEVAEFLLTSDIYCQVSHIENSPNSLCEAMMVGMPIIASFAGGTSSLLKNGEEGILVQDGDPFVLAGSIIEIVTDIDKALTFSKTARDRARRRHNKERIVNDLLQTYKMIVNPDTNNN
jgi:glycosyltransferase involved in cell wall biosynthesis